MIQISTKVETVITMKLVCLDYKNVINLENKQIICFEKSESYLQEIYNKYPKLFKKIICIIDLNPRYQTRINVLGTDFEVYGEDILAELLSNNNDQFVVVITSDYYKEVFDKVSFIFSEKKMTSDCIYYFPNHETEIELSYREKYSQSELQNIIVFRSGPHASSYVPGLDFADNARALFEYLLRIKLNKKYELAWVVNDSKEFIYPDGKYYKYYRDYENLTFVEFADSVTECIDRRDEYYRVLCLAKWIFMTDAYGFCRNAREDQVRVQLWHGCGFKTRTNFVSCEKRYEYNIVISEVYKKIHAEIYGLRDEQVIITGYPKSDWLFHPVSSNITATLGLAPKTAEKVIFWLPTFRKAKENLSELNEKSLQTQTGLPLVDSLAELQELDRLLIDNNMKIIIKLHPFQDKECMAQQIAYSGLSRIVLLDNNQLVDADVQIGQLLYYADALISDYSSVAVEYLLLDRPVAFTLDDVSEYEKSRGFVFENIREWLPGKLLYSFDDFKAFLVETAKGIEQECDKRRRITDQIHLYRDDKSSERVIKQLGIG